MKKLTARELRQFSGPIDERDVLDFDPPSMLRMCASELLAANAELKRLRASIKEAIGLLSYGHDLEARMELDHAIKMQERT